MIRLLRWIHTSIYAWYITRYRTREILRVFDAAHVQELKQLELQYWPLVRQAQGAEKEQIKNELSKVVTATQYKQLQERAAIRAGKLDNIIDRRSWAFPYLPQTVNRMSTPIMKATPYALRRLSRTPIPRKLLNMIKNSVISQPWGLEAVPDVEPLNKDEEGQKERIKIGQASFNHPNNIDSFQTLLEQGIEDICCFGAFSAELRLTPDPARPVKMWAVNVESIRVFPAWTEATPEMPHYAQMTGLKGERGAVIFYDDELLYIKDNPSTDSPFGLGKMEVGFRAISDFLGVQEMSGRAGSDQVHKCFPEGTEVLTRRGWLLWRDVREDDEYATRSLDGELQWQRGIAFVKEWHDGDLIRFSNRSTNITVTPNHRMYGQRVYKGRTKNRKTEPLGFIEAKDLVNEIATKPGKGWRLGKSKPTPPKTLHDFRVPTQSVWKDGVLPAPVFTLGERAYAWEDWMAFLGIWIAEGSCRGSGLDKPTKGEYRVQIAQSKLANNAKYVKIEKLLKRMGINYVAKSDRFLFTDRDIWKYVSVLGNSHTKYVPQWVKDAPANLIQVFVDWAMMGDGTYRGKKGAYYTTSKRLADDMQELFQKTGRSATVTPYVDGKSKMFMVDLMTRTSISIVPAGARGKARVPKLVPYKGYVYCAMVPNGTLYCRENGHPFWSGNTWLWWEQPQSENAYQIVRRHIQNELEGQAKISIIGGMKKPEVVEVNPVTEQDLLLPWQEMLMRVMAAAFDLSPMNAGLEQDVNRAVGQVLSDKDFRNAVVPMATRFQEAFTRKILHEKLGWYDLRFRFLNLEDPDLETKVDICSRMYSMNAATPNEIRTRIGWQKLENQFADLTQFEAMMLNAEATLKMQEAMNNRQMQQQQKMQEDAMKQQAKLAPPMPGQEEVPAVDEGKQFPGKAKLDPNNPQQQQQKPPVPGVPTPKGGGGVKVKAPAKITTPKFPVAAGYTASQIAEMPVLGVANLIHSSGYTATKMLKVMKGQEPGILQEMTEELQEFFKQALEYEKDQRAGKVSPKLLKEWAEEQQKKFSKDNKRVQDFGTWLVKYGNQQRGKLDGKVKKDIGTPGNLNKTRFS